MFFNQECTAIIMTLTMLETKMHYYEVCPHLQLKKLQGLPHRSKYEFYIPRSNVGYIIKNFKRVLFACLW